ncbi:MAG: FG-GAP repeat domain-containing protein [Planctomycetota bacterium]
MQRSNALFTGIAGLFVVSSFASAQQFQNQVGALGGPSYTSFCEGVEVVDLDLDGRLDVVAATGAVFSPGSVGTKIPQVQMNKSVGVGSFTFTDEAASRLPGGFAVQSGGCAGFDIDADGDIDLLFAQMGDRQPQLLRNGGTGIFTNITASNFPVILMRSACAQFGDIDNDGDLDAGLTSQSQLTRMFRNNGAGVFTDITASNMPNITLTQAQDLSLVDIDNDWDLDCLITSRSAVTQKLYKNNGSGLFTDSSSSLGYTGSGNNYEADWTDLDNDGDVDGFWTSLSGFAEGSSKNNLIPGGTLTFTNTTSTVIGTNSGDDNEVTFIDTNHDGRQDIIIGALGSLEKLYLTNPGFTFTFQAGAFNGTNDPTLDGCPGDFDNDNKMDYVSAVGESGSGNKVFRNTGAADNVLPKILRTQALSSPQIGAGPFVFRTMVQDSSYDDGWDFITGKFDVSVEANNGIFNVNNVVMKRMGGHLFRGSIDLAAIGASAPGAKVTYTPKATDRGNNTASATPVTFQVAGFLNYGVGSPGNSLTLANAGTMNINQNSTWVTTGCAANQVGGLLWAEARDNIFNLLGYNETFLLDLVTLGPGELDTAVGTTMSTTLLVPNDPLLIGKTFTFQSFCLDGLGGIDFSQGLEGTIGS